MKATDRFCPIKFVPFRGVNCSDAAGGEVGYQNIQDMLDQNKTATGRQWDSSVSSPWYNYVDKSGTVHQRWCARIDLSISSSRLPLHFDIAIDTANAGSMIQSPYG